MISGSREKDFSTKQEGGFDLGENTKRLCTSRTWSVLKNPRIVRVSRSLGKKDRHSKVSTVRGLRDRRVRLSVQTAIQLYDLQDRLGLNQPSKVVDWLLNAAKTEISELPPLPMLQENCIQNPQSIPSTSRLDKNLDCFKDCGAHSFNSDGILMAKSKYAQNPFSVLNNSSNTISASNAFPYNSWDSSNAFVSHLGSHGFPFQVEELQIPNAIQIPSSLSLSSGSQLNLLPNINNPLEFDSKQADYSQILSRNSQNLLPTSLFTSLYSVSPAMRPFPVNMNQKNSQEIQAKILQKGLSSSSFPNDSRLILGSNTSSIHVQMCESNEENL